MSPWVPRLALAAGAVALIAALVSIAVGKGGPEPPGISGAGETQQLVAGIAQHGGELGSPNAELSIDVFNDLHCRDCAAYHLETIDPLIADWVRTGEARIEFRHFPLTQRELTVGALAAEAAGLQDRQWQYIDLFFRNQEASGGQVDDEFLRELAETVPDLDLERWEADRESERVAEAVRADGLLAAELGIPAQPAVIVEGPGGQRELFDYPSREEIEAALEELR